MLADGEKMVSLRMNASKLARLDAVKDFLEKEAPRGFFPPVLTRTCAILLCIEREYLRQEEATKAKEIEAQKPKKVVRKKKAVKS